MSKYPLPLLVAIAGAMAAGRAARAQEGEPPEGEVDQQGFPYGPPIPPNVEQAPVAGPGGSYCYTGPHPVDVRVAGGSSWDDSQGVHTHFYPPLDLRLFSLRDGCYTFIGDPTDFGYGGEVYSYYGAHPLHESYGGGWCFMIGAHAHPFRPWSPSFVVVGPWYYWHGAYDAAFWSYWPYYSYYYRSFYPRYYGGGRFFRNRDFRVAPPIRRVPYQAGYANPGYGNQGYNRQGIYNPGGSGARAPIGGSGWRGTPSGGTAGNNPRPGNAPGPATPWRSTPPAGGRAAPAPRGWQTAPAPTPPPAPAPAPAPAPRGAWSAPSTSGGTIHTPPPPQGGAGRTGATWGAHPPAKSGNRR
jgi:hypothetical protein